MQIFSLQPTRDSRFQEDLSRLRASVLPAASEWRKLLVHNRRVARHDRSRYLRTLFYVLRQRRPKLLWRPCVALHSQRTSRVKPSQWRARATRPHSKRSAAMGSIRAARRAGYRPNRIPIKAATPKATAAPAGEITVSQPA